MDLLFCTKTTAAATTRRIVDNKHDGRANSPENQDFSQH